MSMTENGGKPVTDGIMSGGLGKKSEYFAAASPDQTASTLLQKSATFYNLLRTNAYMDRIVRCWRYYYGNFNAGPGFNHQISASGEQGELQLLPVNHFRNIAEHILNMVTSNRPIMEARAINTDAKSLSQAHVATGVLEYYMREKRLEDHLKNAVEMAIVMGSGYVGLSWNATAGESYDVDPDTGELAYEGELEFENHSPFDVVFDGTKEDWKHDWIMVRKWKNRHDLAAKYPELKDKIAGLPTKAENMVYRLAVWSNDDTDDVAVYEFFHKRTESMPDGRYLLFASADCVFVDAPMPYRALPVFRIAANNIMGTPYGYTGMYDVFPLQEALNQLYSTIFTNQHNLATQNIWVPEGANVNMNSLVGGMNVISGTPGMKPEPLQLTQTPGEVFKFVEMLVQAMETISGVNSVARGNPEASLKSGTALALVQSMALQFMSRLHQSYIRLIEDVGTSCIQILKDFAHTPKIISIVGINNRSELREFTGEDISSINRVVVDVGNPLSRTIAGRVQMAEQLLQMKLIKNPNQYFQVLNTGKMETMYENDYKELILIKSENEQLMKGEMPITSIIDDHRMHIIEHKGVLNDPEMRKDAVLAKNVLDHIQEHIDLLRTADPDLMNLLGYQSLAPQPPMGGAEGAAPGMDPNQAPSGQGFPSMLPQNEQARSAAMQAQMGGIELPELPRPPGQFKNNPISPSEMIPQ